MDNFDNFIEWMKNNTRLSESSAKKYAGAMRGIEKDLQKERLLAGGLDKVLNTSLQSLMKSYFDYPEYRDRNDIGHNLYSSAFKKFIEFTSEKQK